MDSKPISPAVHGLIDYGFGIVNIAGSALLGLSGPARARPVTWALAQGTLNAFTDQPYAIERAIPFSVHHQAETLGVPALAVVTVASGALKQPRARLFFAGLFVVPTTV
ncbi:MAG: hypothetical protein M3457_23040 [Chloroflexota bacterium]|nr:hypothetical protein [Chloroflexota bacterium]